jgi:hypothetical protein
MHSFSAAVISIRPKVRVRVQRFSCGGVTEPCLNSLNRLSMADKETGVEMSKVVEGHTPPDCAAKGSRPYDLLKRRTLHRSAIGSAEHETGITGWIVT